MKLRTYLRRPLLAALFAALPALAPAQEPATPATPPAGEASTEDADVESLGKAAARFVAAFNAKDAATIAGLFLPEGEMIGRDGETYQGREAIEARYKEIFEGEDVPQVALEASSVHLVAPGVAIEEGVVHFTVSDSEPVKSISYTATQVKQADGSWLIASTRDQLEVTPPSEHLKPLGGLVGEWTYEGDDGVRTEFAMDLDDSGNFLLGDAVATDEDGDIQTTSVRIGWNPATSSLFWWTFDSDGGNATGQWTRSGDGWLIRTSGITADAETNAATQKLSFDGEDTIVWSSTDRVLDGEHLPDIEVRFVRRAPDPDADPLAGTPEEPETK
ncbi:SgcJ/EcaC family oxidoreductase [Luteolibacter arcticus]|uniref:SgcJ/EcaC family oxidoreductase n=1 Tax=Luteolibacter arcticus TaxID=1581411 RepID=A0ABT3GES4_9BACT|nr:SgcJ/EcaC family oxidoreductase [Luteolibacter arcticus]MCW1922112.1 SgcJ/EcaC family oxidoreductase [Luteolibacter arcticus]